MGCCNSSTVDQNGAINLENKTSRMSFDNQDSDEDNERKYALTAEDKKKLKGLTKVQRDGVMKLKPKYRASAISMPDEIQTYFDFMVCSSFEQTYNES